MFLVLLDQVLLSIIKTMETFKLEIFKDNVLQETFANEKSDFKAFKYLLDHQSQSIDWAVRYDGWDVKITNEQTNEINYYSESKYGNNTFK